METKKSPKANLENYRASFLLLGLVIALVSAVGIFQYSKPNAEVADLLSANTSGIDIDMAPVTRQDIPKPPPPVKVYNSEIIDVVKNDIKIIDNLFTIPDPDSDYVFIEIIDPVIEIISDPVDFAPQMPVSTIGEKGLNEFIIKNTKYPDLAIENEIEGTVFLRFVVGTDGTISNIKVLRKVDPLLEEEAIRVLKIIPKFKPGIDKNGRKIAVWMTIPFEFKIQKK